MSSLSKNNIQITIGNSILDGEISKHLAPTIVNMIIKKNRLSGPIVKVKDIMIYSPIGIIAGLHKPKTSFKKGNIAFLASSGSICLFNKDTIIKNKMTIIGNITNGIEKLNDINSGEVLIIEIIK